MESYKPETSIMLIRCCLITSYNLLIYTTQKSRIWVRTHRTWINWSSTDLIRKVQYNVCSAVTCTPSGQLKITSTPLFVKLLGWATCNLFSATYRLTHSPQRSLDCLCFFCIALQLAHTGSVSSASCLMSCLCVLCFCLLHGLILCCCTLCCYCYIVCSMYCLTLHTDTKPKPFPVSTTPGQ